MGTMNVWIGAGHGYRYPSDNYRATTVWGPATPSDR